MTAQTQVYIYNQRNTVVLLDTTGGIGSTRRWEIVYAKELQIQRGVNNVLQFAFINTDEKPVNILGQTLLFRIVNQNDGTLLFQKTLTPTLPLTGLAQLQMTAAESSGLMAQQCYYSLEAVGTLDGMGQIVSAQLNQAVFTDANGTARGIVRIVDSIFPRQVESHVVTVPSHPLPQVNQSITYYTSTYQTLGQTVTTFQAEYSNFIGNITFQGCNVADFVNNYTINDVYTCLPNGVSNIGNTFSYGNSALNQPFTGTQGYTITGSYPYLRIQITNIGSNTTPNFGSNQSNITNNNNLLYGDMVVGYVR